MCSRAVKLLQKGAENERRARDLLPSLLALDDAALDAARDRELARDPELRPGITSCFREHIESILYSEPARARDLAWTVARHITGSLSQSLWILYARARCALGQPAEAYLTIGIAYSRGKRGVPHWATLMIEMAEAEILRAWGHSADALRLIRATAEMIRLYGDGLTYARAKALEARISAAMSVQG